MNPLDWKIPTFSKKLQHLYIRWKDEKRTYIVKRKRHPNVELLNNLINSCMSFDDKRGLWCLDQSTNHTNVKHNFVKAK